MADIEPDDLAFEQMMSEGSSKTEVARVWQALETAIARQQFNRERATEMFAFAVDNCAFRYFKQFPGGAAILFPKHVRRPFATKLVSEFLQAHDNIESQRPVRTGLLRHVLGK